MSLSDYSGLKTEIENWLDHDDVGTSAADLVTLGEARMAREIRFRGMETRAQATLDDRFLALPARFEEMRSLRLLSSETTGRRVKIRPSEVTLEKLEKESLIDAGDPCFFTVHEEIEFSRPPEESMTAEMLYFAHMRPLSDTNTTNALLTKAPDAYLYAALVAAEPFLGEDERLVTWERLYTQARDGINLAYRKSQYGPGVESRVAGPTP